jgi:hypothetical protein
MKALGLSPGLLMAVTRSHAHGKCLPSTDQKPCWNGLAKVRPCAGGFNVEVELKENGGSEGVLYHKLILTCAPGVDLHKIVSEGEQRCLSIAAFFAELSTADDASGIVFDDPVCSLDYRWREGIARRLVEEAKERQVIVFTHDVVFLLLLKQVAEEQQVEQLDQHVRQLITGAGVTVEDLPWVAKAKARSAISSKNCKLLKNCNVTVNKIGMRRMQKISTVSYAKLGSARLKKSSFARSLSDIGQASKRYQ